MQENEKRGNYHCQGQCSKHEIELLDDNSDSICKQEAGKQNKGIGLMFWC